MARLVSETDVIIGVIIWLYSNGWQIEKISPPINQGNKNFNSKELIISKLQEFNIPLNNIKFLSRGADIEARYGNELWRIECKGLGEVTKETVRNSFDRAIASTVSYYNRKDGLRIGIAMPEYFLKHTQNRLPNALREAINMWIFLYVNVDEIYLFSPDKEVPA